MSRSADTITRFLPVAGWAGGYSRATFAADATAAAIVTVMLIPQSLAYAMLAGLPPEAGLYASILPLVAYAVFGTSSTLAVGPVAIVSLMTAVAAGRVAAHGSPEYVAAALTLALLSGLMLLAMGALRLGFLANFLSHQVISGFITASAILIAASQLKHLLGISAQGHDLQETLASIAGNIGQTNAAALVIGLGTIGFLVWSRKGLASRLVVRGLSAQTAAIAARGAPIVAVAATTLATGWLGLETQGVRVVGKVPAGLPPLTWPAFDAALWQSLLGSAALISLIGFVESVSVAQTLAARRRERIEPDQELLALGASNVAASVTGGFPVTGGIARSVVNFDAGAASPAAGLITAGGLLLATLVMTPLLRHLPQATLAATIIVAVLSLVDLGAMRRTWQYSRSDFAAMAATIAATLALGVEAGLLTGVALSLALHLYRTSRPHYAIVGRVPGTEHFRNVKRHKVETSPEVLSIRVDESLYFANARFLEDTISAEVASDPRIEHLVLMCSAVNEIDASALESLEAINARLDAAGVTFHLSEVKGPVMDRLKRSHFLAELTGGVFLSQHEAMRALEPRPKLVG